MRAEGEFSFRSNTADEWSVNGATGDYSGHIFSYSSMFNLYRDFQRAEVAGFTPYVGAGIGLAILDGEFTTNMTDIEIDDEVLAYQFMLGATKSINRSVDLFTEYRFYSTSEVDVTNVGVSPSVLLGSGYTPEIHNVFVGLRFNR